MTTFAHLHLANHKDSIYLLTNANGTYDFVNQRINETEHEIKSTIVHLHEHLEKHTEKSINKELRHRWLKSLQEFHEKPQSLTKTATLAMWGQIHSFFPMTHMALSLTTLYSDYKIPHMDYFVFENEKHKTNQRVFNLNLPIDNADLKDLLYQKTSNQIAFNLSNIEQYTEVQIHSDYSLIQVVDVEDYPHIYDGKINHFKDIKHSNGRFIKFKSNNIEQLTSIIANLPLQFACLFDLWSYSLVAADKYKEGKYLPEQILPTIKRSFERISNFGFKTRDNELQIDDKFQFETIENTSPLLTSGYKFINFLLIFYPDLFEETTVGESQYILNQKPDVAMKIMVNSDTEEVNFCVLGETSLSQEQMLHQLNQEYGETFSAICEEWDISPEICKKQGYSGVITLPVSKETQFLYINPKYESISFNMMQSVYNIVRMYDKSLLNKKLQLRKSN